MSDPTVAPGDAERLRCAAAGDDVAVSALYRDHFDAARRACARVLGCNAEAEDAAQDAMLACLARLPQLDLDTLRFGAYVHAAAVRAAIVRLRARQRTTAISDTLTTGGGDPVVALELAERRRVVRDAVRALPDRQRLAVFRDAYEDRPRTAIADELDLEPNAVGQLLWRARRTLETQLTAA